MIPTRPSYTSIADLEAPVRSVARCSVAEKLSQSTMKPFVAAMQQIADWLEELGMSEYAQRFAENDIDMAVLPDLTDQHLKDLGVSLGHRLKILRAIRDIATAPVAATAPVTPAETERTRQDDAERRQLGTEHPRSRRSRALNLC